MLNLDFLTKVGQLESHAKIYLDAEQLTINLPNETSKGATIVFKRLKTDKPIIDSSVKAVKIKAINTFRLPVDTPFHIYDSDGVTWLDDLARSDLEKLAESVLHQRWLYFKLPLEQPRFHWRFDDRKNYLAGTLELTINNPVTAKKSITIFSEGNVSEDWALLGERKNKDPDDHSIYFGFHSTELFNLGIQDQVTIRYKCVNDLPGIGAEMQGILPKGNYESTSPVKIYFNQDSDDTYAFLSDWTKHWPLVITSNEGWLPK